MARPTGKLAVGISEFSYLAAGYGLQSAGRVDPTKHLVGALFYPSDITSQRGSNPRWIPSYKYAKGFLQFTLGPVKRSKKLIWRYAAFALEPLLTLFGYLLGHSFKIPARKGLPISSACASWPVILVSHGVGGNRYVHSCLCCELASQGFCVMSIEHADGSASAVHLAGPENRWIFFQGASGEEMKQQLLHRLDEMRTAARLLQSLAKGLPDAGLTFHDAVKDFSASLKGRLDMSCLACLGHSFGGGPSCALPAESDIFKCGIGMDPYWPSLPPDHPVFSGLRNPAPLLLIGSQSWNDTGVKSYLRTAKERETLVQSAASRARGGGGILSMVMRGIGHASFSDAELLFGNMVPQTVLSTNPAQKMPPQLCMCLLKEVILTFLKDHLPLNREQRGRIDPTGPRQQHPAGKAQPGNPMEGAEATVKGAVLNASNDAAEEALAPGGGNGVQENTGHSIEFQSQQVGQGQMHETQDLFVHQRELTTYRRVLGQGNIFAMQIQE